MGLFVQCQKKSVWFDYQKTNTFKSVRCLNLFKEYFRNIVIWCTMFQCSILNFHLFEVKNRVFQLNLESLFDVYKMMFKSVRYSMKWCLPISDGSVNSHSQKIHAWKQCWTFHFSSKIVKSHLHPIPLKIMKNRKNCHSQNSRFTQKVKHEITFPLDSRKFWTQLIT